MTIKEFSKELFNLYGPVTRARGCFLYTKKGVRITDLYQENGRAILGWDAGNAFTHFKNVLSRGQVGSFLCEDHSRLTKAVSTLLCSERELFFFPDKVSAIKTSLQLSQESTCVYRPWCLTSEQLKQLDCMIIEPPLPWTNTVYILAVNKSLIEKLSTEDYKFLEEHSMNLPFALQAAITRSIYNLMEAEKSRQEKDWFIYDTVLTKYFKRTGPYLYPTVPQEKYDDFVLHCLKLGIAINPEVNGVSIVPYGADKGVFTALKNSPFIY